MQHCHETYRHFRNLIRTQPEKAGRDAGRTGIAPGQGLDQDSGELGIETYPEFVLMPKEDDEGN